MTDEIWRYAVGTGEKLQLDVACTCGKSLRGREILQLKQNARWRFVECPRCLYDWALPKLERLAGRRIPA